MVALESRGEREVPPSSPEGEGEGEAEELRGGKTGELNFVSMGKPSEEGGRMQLEH